MTQVDGSSILTHASMSTVAGWEMRGYVCSFCPEVMHIPNVHISLTKAKQVAMASFKWVLMYSLTMCLASENQNMCEDP